jgi:DNA-directed RNA polymerase specialized sigma24 family protein
MPMDALAEAVLLVLPRLRRYGVAVTGSRRAADQYIELCLETLVQEPDRIALDGDVAVQMFRLFHQAVDACGVEAATQAIDAASEGGLQQAITALALADRRLVLLTLLEGVAVASVAELLGVPTQAAVDRLAVVCAQLKQACAARIVMIEHEAKKADDLAHIISDSGHEVVGVAPGMREAKALMAQSRPNLILADTRDAKMGAIRRLIADDRLPVIFLGTRASVKLLRDGPDSVFVIDDQQDPAKVEATINRALFSRAAEDTAQLAAGY